MTAAEIQAELQRRYPGLEFSTYCNNRRKLTVYGAGFDGEILWKKRWRNASWRLFVRQPYKIKWAVTLGDLFKEMDDSVLALRDEAQSKLRINSDSCVALQVPGPDADEVECGKPSTCVVDGMPCCEECARHLKDVQA
jgi:hypothetical protein